MPISELRQQIGFSEAKSHFSALTTQANALDMPFVVTKNKKPWVEVRPLAAQAKPRGAITIKPIQREISIANLDELFSDYDGAFVPQEDGFASPVGQEVI